MKKLLLVFAIMLISCGGDDNPECPDGGSIQGTAGVEQWCAIPDGDGGWIKHGPCRRWNKTGHVSQTGEYCNGRSCGQWNNWYDNGNKSSEIYYNDGEPCGTWTAWDEDGNVTDEEEHDPC